MIKEKLKDIPIEVLELLYIIMEFEEFGKLDNYYEFNDLTNIDNSSITDEYSNFSITDNHK